ncbi:uncharacterized protein LOC111122512 [Crassostrea virginica]|uniref:Uncharacterized protein LOC111122512 n=1 Tax=Crassostrea virginica TaxID=6565 RepID=A0A8B8CXN3_CRAVI|nr:uncharacterized protein LOC111122512 [Crassostrea virginica]
MSLILYITFILSTVTGVYGDGVHYSCHGLTCDNNQVAFYNIFVKHCDCHCVDSRGCEHLSCAHSTHPTCHMYLLSTDCKCEACFADRDCSCAKTESPVCIHDLKGHYCKCVPIQTSPESHGTSHTTRSTTTTTTTIPLEPLDCSNQKISVIESIAENLHVEDDRAGLCPGTNKHQTSEALVIHKCNATARSSWSKGVSIKAECENQLRTLAPYTPVSSFFPAGENLAGFFIGCTEQGFRMALQTCTDSPMIRNITDLTKPHLSDFYTILSL